MASSNTLKNGSVPVATRSSGRRRKPVVPFDEALALNTKPSCEATKTTKRQPLKPSCEATKTTKRQPPKPSVSLEDYTQKELEKLNL